MFQTVRNYNLILNLVDLLYVQAFSLLCPFLLLLCLKLEHQLQRQMPHSSQYRMAFPQQLSHSSFRNTMQTMLMVGYQMYLLLPSEVHSSNNGIIHWVYDLLSCNTCSFCFKADIIISDIYCYEYSNTIFSSNSKHECLDASPLT